MRKNMFDTILSLYDIDEELCQLQVMFYKTPMLRERPGSAGYTMHYFINQYFTHWPHSHTCISLDDYIEKLNNDGNYSISNESKFSGNSGKISDRAFGNAEFFYNMYEFSLGIITSIASNNRQPYFLDQYHTELYKKFKYKLDVLIDHIFGMIEKVGENAYIIVPRDEAISVVVEGVSDEEIRKAILLYNHFSFKNSLEEKATILRKLFIDVDAYEKIQRSEATEDFRFIVNNADVRHNNTGKKKGKSLTDGMNDNQIEELYDMAYRLYIAGKLADEYKKEIKNKVTQLKNSMSGVNNI